MSDDENGAGWFARAMWDTVPESKKDELRENAETEADE